MSQPIKLTWNGEQRYTATDSYGRAVQIDGDLKSSEGAKPSDLLPIALAACVVYTLVDVLAKRKSVATAIEASVQIEQDPDPPWRFRSISIHVAVRGPVDEATLMKYLRLAHEKYCAVSASLHPETEVRFSAEVASD